MAGWHHWLNGHEFKQAPGDSGRQTGVLQSVGSQRVGHDWATEQQPSVKKMVQTRGTQLTQKRSFICSSREAKDARGGIPVHERRSFQRQVLGSLLV